ncbi:PD40 domain-containing protein [bacterium]|nr:PD40 domain-containing protein [bacterium]
MRIVAHICCLALLTLRCGPSNIDYLGQKPPGSTPKVFAPGIVSSEHQEHSTLAISSDGKSMYWSRWPLPRYRDMLQTIYYIQLENGKWTDPLPASFSGKYSDGSPAFSPDGARLYFSSERPVHASDSINTNYDIWYVEKINNSIWGDPIHLGFTDRSEYGICFTQKGDMYFSAGYKSGGISDGSVDIFVSRSEKGRFKTPVRLDAPINTVEHRDAYPCIAPDESFLIFNMDTRRFTPEGRLLDGDRSLFISFRKVDNTWSKPMSMGHLFDSPSSRFTGLSPDGKFLFFTRYVDGQNEDLFWVDASIIPKQSEDDE